MPGPRPPASGSEAPRLSVVISTLGNHDLLRRVLDGYSRQTADPASFEVVVVADAAETDPEAVTGAIAERAFHVTRATGDTPGLSANRNAGWRAARAPLVLYTDNDTVPVRRLVEEHVEWHRRHPETEVGVLGLVRWAPEIEVTTFMRWLDMGLQFGYANYRGHVDLPWAAFAGANSSLKRAFIERVGDFDQEHFPYGYEDTDWAYRASKLGFRMVYNRKAVVDHVRPMSIEFYKRRIRRVAAAEHTFTRLHPELPPFWHERFASAATFERPRGRAARIARFVPRRVPWLGPRVWAKTDLYFRQVLAQDFLEAWEEAGAQTEAPPGPDLSEFRSDR